MGIFYEQADVVNRTSKPLMCRFDGQDIVIPPNYTETGELIAGVKNMIPVIAVPYAKSQNVQMGSEDPEEPSEFEVLVGIRVKDGQQQVDDISYCEQTDELTRVRLADYLNDASLKVVVGRREVKRKDTRRAERPVSPFEVVVGARG